MGGCCLRPPPRLLLGLVFRTPTQRAQSGQLRPDLGDGQDAINGPRAVRRARHLAELGFFRILDDREPAQLLDATKPLRSVRACTGQDDAPRRRAVGIGERAEEVVDRRPVLPRGSPRSHLEVTVHAREVAVGGDHVDVVGQDGGALPDLAHGHRRFLLENIGETTFVVRGEMHDDDERKTRGGGRVLEKLLQGADSPR